MTAASSWLDNSLDGYCSITGGFLSEGTCAEGVRGTWNLLRHERAGKGNTGFFGHSDSKLVPRNAAAWNLAVAHCLRLCSYCERCNYVSVSLQWADCSWFHECPRWDEAKLLTDVAGFRSAPVVSAVKHARSYDHMARIGGTLLSSMGEHKGEVDLRWTQLMIHNEAAGYNMSGISAIANHPSLRSSIRRGIHLSIGGRRWLPEKLSSYMTRVYLRHNNQSAWEREQLARRWQRTLVGEVHVWDLINLLHFTIDHTDKQLMYTSQLIHCLQVYNMIREKARLAPTEADGGGGQEDSSYWRDMLISGLIHDIGKLLTVFGETDENTDCMNRILDVGGRGGLDSISFHWNHDSFGHAKLASYLPPRVQDVLKFHSLREIPYLLNAPPDEGEGSLGQEDVIHAKVTRAEALDFQRRASVDDVERARFVAHFATFDAGSKVITDTIPRVDMDEVINLIESYFPGGKIVW